MDLSKLALTNPWWRGAENIESEPSIKAFRAAPLKWYPSMMDSFSLETDMIYTIRGPRQVGKTTMMKLLIEDLLHDGASPPSILYFTCDMIEERSELEGAVRIHKEFSDRQSPGERRYLFIDEISGLKGWEKSIKLLVDTGILADCTAFLTGSHCLDIKYSAERLPGRRGEWRAPVNRVLQPLAFPEFVRTRSPDLARRLKDILDRKPGERFLSLSSLVNGHLPESSIDLFEVHRGEIERLFHDYLLTGGIMRAINDLHTNRSISSGIFEIYVRTVIGDIVRWGFQERIARRILRSMAGKMTSRVSLNSIAKENEIGSHNTVSDYLSALEDSFTIHQLHELELHRMAPNYRRERKVYFTDPFIFHSVRGWLHGRTDYYEYSRESLLDDTFRGALVEMVVSSHLAALLRNLSPSDVFDLHEKLMIWRKKGSDQEVDFVMVHGEEMIPVEVKYRNRVDRSDLKGLFNLGNGVVVSKEDSWSYGQYSCVPAEFFLLLV